MSTVKKKTPPRAKATSKSDPTSVNEPSPALLRYSSEKQFTVDEMIAALEWSHGMITVAATRLNCAADTVRKYIDENAVIRRAYEAEKERSLDNAELQLMKLIRNGNTAAIIFYLKTQGKKRGYVERVEHLFMTPAMLQRFQSIADRSGRSPGELFEDMINALSAELESTTGSTTDAQAPE